MLEIFEFEDLVAAASSGARTVLDRLDVACRELGAFALIGVPLADGLIERMHRVTLDFFSLPDRVKASLVSTDGDQYVGWRGIADNRNEFGFPDHKEMFHIGPRVDRSLQGPDAAGTLPPPAGPKEWSGCSLWPVTLPEMAATWHEYYRAMQQVATGLGTAMAAALGVPAQRWRNLVQDNWADLAANFYPPVNATTQAGVRNAVHRDLTMFTVLYRDSGGGGGLYMQSRDSTWHAVPPTEGQFLVNVGELLTYLTGGRWWAVPHEVSEADPAIPGAHTIRISIPFFYRPNDHRTIRPLLEIAPGHAIQVGAWVRERKQLART